MPWQTEIPRSEFYNSWNNIIHSPYSYPTSELRSRKIHFLIKKVVRIVNNDRACLSVRSVSKSPKNVCFVIFEYFFFLGSGGLNDACIQKKNTPYTYIPAQGKTVCPSFWKKDSFYFVLRCFPVSALSESPRTCCILSGISPSTVPGFVRWNRAGGEKGWQRSLCVPLALAQAEGCA